MKTINELMKKRLFLFIIILQTFNIHAKAQSSNTKMNGRVMDKNTHKGIHNAKVKLSIMFYSNSDMDSTITDSAGYFHFKNIPSGKYKTTIIAKGYFSDKSGIGVVEGYSPLIPFELSPIMVSDQSAPLKDVYFQSKSYNFQTNDSLLLSYCIIILKNAINKNNDTKIQLNGYSDNSECPVKDTTLSYKRAFTVKQILIKNGIDSHRISIKAYGGKQPYAHEKRKNRRVEFILMTN